MLVLWIIAIIFHIYPFLVDGYRNAHEMHVEFYATVGNFALTPSAVSCFYITFASSLALHDCWNHSLPLRHNRFLTSSGIFVFDTLVALDDNHVQASWYCVEMKQMWNNSVYVECCEKGIICFFKLTYIHRELAIYTHSKNSAFLHIHHGNYHI